MFKIITLFLMIINLSCVQAICFPKVNMSDKKTKTCFSKKNFAIVTKYIETQIKNNKTDFYPYEGYELYINGETEISVKKNGYTLSKITEKKGIISLAKSKRNNNKIIEETNHFYCKIVLDAYAAVGPMYY